MLGNSTVPSGNIGEYGHDRLRPELGDVDRLGILHEDGRQLLLQADVGRGDLPGAGTFDEEGEAELRTLRLCT